MDPYDIPRSRRGSPRQRQSMPSQIPRTANSSRDFSRKTEILMKAYWITPNPSFHRIEELAGEAALSIAEVTDWFASARTFIQAATIPNFDFHNSEPTPDPTLTINIPQSQTNSSDHELLGLDLYTEPLNHGCQMENTRVLASRFPPRNPENRGQASSGRKPRHGTFPCLDCRKSFDSAPGWKYHYDRTHFPDEGYKCPKPSQDGCKFSSDHIFTRKDNYKKHLHRFHNYQGENLSKEIKKQSVAIDGLFHDTCGFCSETLIDREQSMAHILNHLREGKRHNDWCEKCTSSNHDIMSHVRREALVDESSTDGDSSEGNDRDQDDPNGGNAPDGNFDFLNNAGFDFHDDFEGGEGGASGDASFQPMGLASSYAAIGHRCPTKSFAPSYSMPEKASQSSKASYRLSLIRVLGIGNSSTVYEVYDKVFNRRLACKLYEMERADLRNSLKYRAFENEVRILGAVRHPHIVKLVGSSTKPGRPSILTLPVADTNLANHLRTITGPITSKLDLCSNIASGLDYLHSLSIVHGDLKPANILIFLSHTDDRSHYTARITDFGTSAIYSGIPSRRVTSGNTADVTPKYAPPELATRGQGGFAADIFSLGCIFAEILTVMSGRSVADFQNFRAMRHGDNSYSKTLDETHKWIQQLDEEQNFEECPPSISSSLVREMLRQDPGERPSAHEVWLRSPQCVCCSDLSVRDGRNHSQNLGLRSPIADLEMISLIKADQSASCVTASTSAASQDRSNSNKEKPTIPDYSQSMALTLPPLPTRLSDVPREQSSESTLTNTSCSQSALTPTKHRITKAKSAKRSYPCEYPGCTKVCSFGTA